MGWLQRMKHKLKQACSLSIQDWGIFTEAWLTLTWIDFTISYLPFQHWKGWLSSLPENRGEKPPIKTSSDISHLVWLLNAAANNHPGKPTCLRRSLGLKKMLERRNTPVTLRIGINKDGADLKAHAWVEHNGMVINDVHDITSHYSPLPAPDADLLRKA